MTLPTGTTTANDMPGSQDADGAQITGNGSTPRRAIPQKAIDAANVRVQELGGALAGLADTIDDLFERQALPFGNTFQGAAGNAAGKLRSLSDRVGGQDAGELVDSVQRAAAARPRLAVAIGAVAGAAAAFFLIRTAPGDLATA